MRTVGVVLCAFLAIGCKKKLEQERRETLDFARFSINVPKGWHRVTDKKIRIPPKAEGLVPQTMTGASIFVQELELDPEQQKALYMATEETCKNEQASIIRAQPTFDPDFVRVTKIGQYRGCDYQVIERDSTIALRQISITDASLAVSVVCTRNKKGEPEVDAVCERIASLVNRK